ncbi:MAG: hypothetical protein EXQ56_01745 [Acidobacteria bacterium]|nr:hypothetical protein [Acidobacteriota bacterium]
MIAKNQPKPANTKVPLPPPDYHASDETFLQILLAQAGAAAARQSQDRLAGWNQAIQLRLETQSISSLDAEILAHAEKQTASEVARLEANRRRAIARANAVAGRPTAEPLLAVVEPAPPSNEDAQGLELFERDVVPRGQELLKKLFQSYSVGGVSVSELLWQEQQATQVEMNYRVWAVTTAFEATVNASSGGR